MKFGKILKIMNRNIEFNFRFKNNKNKPNIKLYQKPQ